METKVLILGDFVGCGDVAMATARAILTKLGCTVLCLPTALISNTWNLGAPAVLDTTDYLKESLQSWSALGIRPDAVLIGYLANEAQAEFVARQCRAWHDAGVKIFLDPIFADNGRLYRGVDSARIGYLRELVKIVDYLFPNATEACFLADAATPREAFAGLKALGAKAFLITGAPAGSGNAVLLWDGSEEAELPYDPVPGSFGGAGDAFTALFLGHLLSGRSPKDSARLAMQTTKAWILQTKDTPRPCVGLPVERCFQ